MTMEKLKATTEKYEGPAGNMRKSPWLASEDLDGLEVDVEIESVMKHENVEMDKGRVEKELYTLKFKGKDKQMCLNATNIKKLASRFTADTRQWSGKTVRLYVQHGIKAFGEIRSGLRIK